MQNTIPKTIRNSYQRGKLRTNHWKLSQPCDFGVVFWSHSYDCFLNGAKRCQTEPKLIPKGVKMMRNNFPTHNHNQANRGHIDMFHKDTQIDYKRDAESDTNNYTKTNWQTIPKPMQ